MRWPANAALVVGSVAFSLALLFAVGEVALQTAYGSVPPGPPAEWNVYDARRGWALKPGHYSYFDVKAMRRVDVAINELGLRNGPLSPEPAPGVQRVSVLGDSFIFGAALGAGETITGQLQALAGPGFEVVNISVPGYGTGQQYRLVEALQAKGYRLGSKLVLAFFTNDLQDNLGLDYASLARNPRQPVFSVDLVGYLQQTEPRPPAKSRGGSSRGLLARSLFLQFVRYHLEVLVVSYPAILSVLEAIEMTPALPRTPGIVAGWHGAEWDTRWRVTEGVLENLVRTVRAMPHGPELYIAFVPSPFQVHESFRLTVEALAGGDARYASFLSDPDRPQRMLQALARRLDVAYVDLTPALRLAAANAVVYFPREGHFNEAGSAIAAGVIYQQAIRNEQPL
jgi:hypothetical protein